MDLEEWIKSHLAFTEKTLLDNNDITYSRYQPTLVNPQFKFLCKLRRNKYLRLDEVDDSLKQAFCDEFENRDFYLKYDDHVTTEYDESEICESTKYGVLVYQLKKSLEISQAVRGIYDEYKDQIDFSLASSQHFVISSNNLKNNCFEINNWIPLIEHSNMILGFCWEKADPMYMSCAISYDFGDDSYTEKIKESASTLLHHKKKLLDVLYQYGELNAEKIQQYRESIKQQETIQETQEVTVEETQEVTVEETQEVTVEETQEVTVEETQEVTVEETQEVTVEETTEAIGQEPQEAAVEEKHGTGEETYIVEELVEVVNNGSNDITSGAPVEETYIVEELVEVVNNDSNNVTEVQVEVPEVQVEVPEVPAEVPAEVQVDVPADNSEVIYEQVITEDGEIDYSKLKEGDIIEIIEIIEESPQADQEEPQQAKQEEQNDVVLLTNDVVATREEFLLKQNNIVEDDVPNQDNINDIQDNVNDEQNNEESNDNDIDYTVLPNYVKPLDEIMVEEIKVVPLVGKELKSTKPKERKGMLALSRDRKGRAVSRSRSRPKQRAEEEKKKDTKKVDTKKQNKKR